jgi:death-on-curing family protein
MNNREMQTGNIVIYQSEDGDICINARIEDETIWLTQQMMVDLFQSSKANINEHISNIFDEQELEKSSTVRNFRTVQKEGTREVARNITCYNLDMIISVGYRVKSKVATQFRKWATKTLREYLVNGYTLHEQRLLEKNRQLQALKTAIDLMERGINNQIKDFTRARHLTNFLQQFSIGLEMLDDYDHRRLDKKGLSKRESPTIEPEEFLEVVIQSMQKEFSNNVFGVPKDSNFESSVRQIYQSFGGVDCYETLEEKAATLLYLIVKNHSFIDGNKRIAASCFLYFLEKNKALHNKNGFPRVDSCTLFALTILIAESKPSEMEIVKDIVITILNRNTQ